MPEQEVYLNNTTKDCAGSFQRQGEGMKERGKREGEVKAQRGPEL